MSCLAFLSHPQFQSSEAASRLTAEADQLRARGWRGVQLFPSYTQLVDGDLPLRPGSRGLETGAWLSSSNIQSRESMADATLCTVYATCYLCFCPVPKGRQLHGVTGNPKLFSPLRKLKAHRFLFKCIWKFSTNRKQRAFPLLQIYQITTLEGRGDSSLQAYWQ